jgi:RimJ/RimL family protein N-acetyltransferase
MIKYIQFGCDNMFDLLIGKNIILRKAKEKDYESMLNNVWGDEEVYKWMLYTPTKTIEDSIDRLKRSMEYQKDHYAYFIALKDTDEAIGLCAIKEYEPNRWEESGICIGTKYQGNGYGKEILSLLLDLAFNKLNAIDFRYGYFIDNLKSKKLAEFFNFKFVSKEEFIRPWDQEKKIIDLCLLNRNDYLNNILAKLTFKDIQPSQLYISKKKIEDINKWFNKDDLSNFTPIPLRYLNGKFVIVDGHTRAVVAIMNHLDKVPFEIEKEEWDWEMYDECVKECIKRNINSPYDLLNYIIPENEYDFKWNQWCDNMQTNIQKQRIYTDRLELRKWRYEDASFMYELAKDPDVGLNAGWHPHKSISDSLNRINEIRNNHPYCFAICLKDKVAPIGCIELKTITDMTDKKLEYELGYWLGKDYWNNGYMTEAAKALIEFGFSILNLNAIWCGYYEGNIKSKRVQEKLGFEFVNKTDDLYLESLNEIRTGYSNKLTKEKWMLKNSLEMK